VINPGRLSVRVRQPDGNLSVRIDAVDQQDSVKAVGDVGPAGAGRDQDGTQGLVRSWARAGSSSGAAMRPDAAQYLV
jgi:hypothetical protein